MQRPDQFVQGRDRRAAVRELYVWHIHINGNEVALVASGLSSYLQIENGKLKICAGGTAPFRKAIDFELQAFASQLHV